MGWWGWGWTGSKLSAEVDAVRQTGQIVFLMVSCQHNVIPPITVSSVSNAEKMATLKTLIHFMG